MQPKFILSKSKLLEQVKKLTDLDLDISYSYKTNRKVGEILQDIAPEVDFSIHAEEEISDIKDKSKIHFFTQAELEEDLKKILNLGVRSFVVDNVVDFKRLIKIIEETKTKIDLSLRMKFQEHRVGTGKYFVYGMPATEVNELIKEISNHEFINKLGIHLHRKSQNTSEWEIVEELEDSIDKNNLERLDFLNLGGGLPSIYRSSSVDVFEYVFAKLKKAQEWLKNHDIQTLIEPGRFLAAPCITLETQVIQKYDRNLVVNTTIYNAALDNVLTGTKMLVEGELSEEGKEFLIKGNSPTRDDIFRYKVQLPEDTKVGDTITFINAGAYNYTTVFFGYKKLETEVVE